MSIRRRRLTMVAGALLLLSIIGAGLVQAAPASASSVAAASAPSALNADRAENAAGGPGGHLGERLRVLRERFGDGRLARQRQHLVHGTFTVLKRDGELMTIQLDHGTVSAIEDGSITIAEAGGSSVTVSATADTKVRKDRAPASLGVLEIGDEVVVHSVVEDGSATARLVFVPPPAPARTGDAS